jgi:hypothetical protein
MSGIAYQMISEQPGKTYLFFGLETGIVDAGELADWRVDGRANPGMAGSSLSAGDLDGDQALDLIVGEREHSTGGILSGAVHVYYGPFSAERGPADPEATIVGETSGAFAGYSVASGGDLDGDGFDELLIGTTGVREWGEDSSGAVSLFFGGSF